MVRRAGQEGVHVAAFPGAAADDGSGRRRCHDAQPRRPPAPAGADVAPAGRPAVLRPVVEAQALCSADPQLVVALTQFAPPRGGHATLVVSLRGPGERMTRLGEVGVFPERPFSAALAGAMRFGFAVPRDRVGANLTVVVAMT